MFCEANNTKLNSSKSNVLKMCLKQKTLQYVLTSKIHVCSCRRKVHFDQTYIKYNIL